jgi:Mn-dependent DtxR family transcriptional regulator
LKQSGEDYLESILRIGMERGNVRSIDVAHDLGVSKPSVSVAVHNLEQAGYLRIEGHDLTLTAAGRAIAERVMERHELFYNFLIGLGVDSKVAEEDACKLEHALSAESFEAIKGFVEKNLKK